MNVDGKFTKFDARPAGQQNNVLTYFREESLYFNSEAQADIIATIRDSEQLADSSFSKFILLQATRANVRPLKVKRFADY